jgi:glycosyltransferase involved in cell wall biosynthesis
MKIKVLQLIYGFMVGGSERQMLQLTKLLQDSGRYDVRIACLMRTGVLLEEAEGLAGHAPEFPIKSFYGPSMVRELWRFASFLRGGGFDVVHTHDFYSNIFGMTGAALARTPARVASRRETGGLRTERQKFGERCAYRLSHAVVANARAVKDCLVSEGVPAGKIVTLYNGLDLSRAAPAQGARRDEVLDSFGLPRTPRRFVTIVANMQHAVKDHPTFLRAARRVRDVVPDAAFVLAGDGRLTGELRAYAAELGLAEDVFFTGRCERVGDLLSVSDVCVLSSTAEGFSNSILEYMAASRPVVATDVGGAREAIEEGETGYVVAPGDDEAMAAGINALLQDPERARQMGERGRRVVEEKFSCGAQLARTEALYERLLERRTLRQGATASARSESV